MDRLLFAERRVVGVGVPQEVGPEGVKRRQGPPPPAAAAPRLQAKRGRTVSMKSRIEAATFSNGISPPALNQQITCPA